MSGKRYPEEFKIQAVEQVTKQVTFPLNSHHSLDEIFHIKLPVLHTQQVADNSSGSSSERNMQPLQYFRTHVEQAY